MSDDTLAKTLAMLLFEAQEDERKQKRVPTTKELLDWAGAGTPETWFYAEPCPNSTEEQEETDEPTIH